MMKQLVYCDRCGKEVKSGQLNTMYWHFNSYDYESKKEVCDSCKYDIEQTIHDPPAEAGPR